MPITVKLLVYLLAIILAGQLIGYGNRYLRFTASALFAFADFWEAYEQVLPSKRHPCGR